MTNKLTEARLHWARNDWEALDCIDLDEVQSSEEKTEILLYKATACCQLGQVDLAKEYFHLVSSSEINSALLERVLISGAFNSLGRAFREKDEGDVQTSDLYFRKAAKVALGRDFDLTRDGSSRQSQLSRIDNIAEVMREGALHRSSPKVMEGDSSESVGTLITKLRKFYVKDRSREIWYRPVTEEFEYSDGQEVEERIYDALRDCVDVGVFSSELQEFMVDWPSEYHLSADRANLLRPFEEALRGSEILEMGCGCGAITRYLGETAEFVIGVEGSRRRAEIAAERCRDLSNVAVVNEQLQSIPIHHKFDVVTLIGVLEYSRLYINDTDPIGHVLAKALSYLKDDGFLILAIENQVGLKYFAGAPEDHGMGVMAGINDTYADKTPVTFGRWELEARLRSAGFYHVQTNLLFPDYKMPSLIVHPEGYAADNDFDFGQIASTTVSFDRQNYFNPLFSLEAAWPLVIRNQMAADMANSFVFIASKSDINDVFDSFKLATYYSPNRTLDTSQEVSFSLANNEVLVTRRRLNEPPKSDISSTERYMRGAVHANTLYKIMQRPGWTLEEVEEWMQVWLDALISAEIEPLSTPENWPSSDTYLPQNYLDAIPRNLIITEAGFHEFFDLEWDIGCSVPLSLVLYRGLLITLTGVRSIACPSDNRMRERESLFSALMQYSGYSLSAAHQHVFNKVMTDLSETASGIIKTESPSTERKAMPAFHVRPLSPAQEHEERAQLAVYFEEEFRGFDESDRVQIDFAGGGEELELFVDICERHGSLTKLRVDISDRPGCFFISELVILSSTGDILWQWDFDLGALERIHESALFIPESNAKQVCVQSLGNDPQFELKLPDACLKDLERGGKICLKLKAFFG